MSDLKFAESDDVLALLAKRKAEPSEASNMLTASLRTPEELARFAEACGEQYGTPAPILIPRRGIPVELVISGGQTGADRAGLDAALAVGLPIDGYCPAGRPAEDGVIDERYPLRETGSSGFGERTALNVKHSVATLLVSLHPIDVNVGGGSAKTLRLCHKHGRPCLPVQLHRTLPASGRMVAQVVAWLRKRNVIVLNVAGPRESKERGLYAAALAFLTNVLGQEPVVHEEAPVVVPALELLP